MDWKTVSAQSPYKTAQAIKQELQQHDIQEALIGIEELIDTLSRSDRRALKSQLIRLMLHIIKWHTQISKRNSSWLNSIKDAREEIVDIQEQTPSLNDAVIRSLWDKCFATALRHAQAEMQEKSALQTINWQQVFEDDYKLDNEF